MEKVGCSVGQSCFRMDSEDTLPALQDVYDDCGDDRFSPGISDRMSLNCHVDLDSLGWYIGRINGPLRPGRVLEYLPGGAYYVVLLVCRVCRSFRLIMAWNA